MRIAIGELDVVTGIVLLLSSANGGTQSNSKSDREQPGRRGAKPAMIDAHISPSYGLLFVVYERNAARLLRWSGHTFTPSSIDDVHAEKRRSGCSKRCWRAAQTVPS